jgi:hypothetical protein
MRKISTCGTNLQWIVRFGKGLSLALWLPFFAWWKNFWRQVRPCSSMCKQIGRERRVSGTDSIIGNELPSYSGSYWICHVQFDTRPPVSNGNSQSGLSSHHWPEHTAKRDCLMWWRRTNEIFRDFNFMRRKTSPIDKCLGCRRIKPPLSCGFGERVALWTSD